MTLLRSGVEDSPSVTFDDRVAYPALTSSLYADVRPPRSTTQARARNVSKGEGVPSARDDAPSLLETVWEWDVMQWVSGRTEGPSGGDGEMPFTQATAGLARTEAPVWSPFRSLTFSPGDSKARLRNTRAVLPPPDGAFVVNQGSDQEATIAECRALETSRNTVSLAAIARMEGLSVSHTEGVARSSRSTLAKASRAAMRRRRAIQFSLHDVQRTQRFSFSTPRTIELTSDFVERPCARASDAVAYRFCFFGPVGLILQLRGGLNVYVIFRSIHDAETAHAFFQQAIESIRRRESDVGRVEGKGWAQRGLRFLNLTSSGSRTKGAESDRTSKAETPAKKKSSDGQARPSSSEASQDGSRGERTGTLLNSSMQASRESTVSERGGVPPLRVPLGGWLNLRPLAQRAVDTSGPGEVSPGTVERAFRKMYLRPSKVMRRYMRTIPSRGAFARGPLNRTDTSLEDSSAGGSRAALSHVQAGEGPAGLVVHLSRSQIVWWQRLKHALGPAPASLAVDVRRSRVTNLDSGGTRMVWAIELPGDYPAPLDPALERIVGPLTRGVSQFAPGESCFRAEMEASLPTPHAKELWLQWFELLGAVVEWTWPTPMVSPVVVVEPASTAPGAAVDGARPRASSDDRARSLSHELHSPGDLARTATPCSPSSPGSCASDTSAGGTAETPVEHQAAPPHTGRDVYLHDTSSHSSSRYTAGERRNPQSRRASFGEHDTPPALPLREGTVALAYVRAPSGDGEPATETSGSIAVDTVAGLRELDLSPLSPAPPSTAPVGHVVLRAEGTTAAHAPAPPPSTLTRRWRVLESDDDTSARSPSPPPGAGPLMGALRHEPAGAERLKSRVGAAPVVVAEGGVEERRVGSPSPSEKSPASSPSGSATQVVEGRGDVAGEAVVGESAFDPHAAYTARLLDSVERERQTRDAGAVAVDEEETHNSPPARSAPRRSATRTPSPPPHGASPAAAESGAVPHPSATLVRPPSCPPPGAAPPPPPPAPASDVRPAHSLHSFLRDVPASDAVARTAAGRAQPTMVGEPGGNSAGALLVRRESYSEGDSIPPPPSSERSTESDLATPPPPPPPPRGASDGSGDASAQTKAHRPRSASMIST